MKATVLIPTYADRGPCLRYTVDSILRQTVAELEVFIMGDGVTPRSREIILDICGKHPQVRFFDHPKHARRGETYRHDALMNHARGEIICYLGDHDLYLPDHVEKMYAALRDADFAHSLAHGISDHERMIFFPVCTFTNPATRAEHGRFHDLTPLNFGAHRLDFYRALPEGLGWHTTPAEWPTDAYFYNHLMNAPGVRIQTVYEFTVIYLSRILSKARDQPGAFEQEVAGWHQRLIQPGFPEEYRALAMRQLVEYFSQDRRKLRRLLEEEKLSVRARVLRLLGSAWREKSGRARQRVKQLLGMSPAPQT